MSPFLPRVRCQLQARSSLIVSLVKIQLMFEIVEGFLEPSQHYKYALTLGCRSSIRGFAVNYFRYDLWKLVDRVDLIRYPQLYVRHSASAGSTHQDTEKRFPGAVCWSPNKVQPTRVGIYQRDATLKIKSLTGIYSLSERAFHKNRLGDMNKRLRDVPRC